VSRKNLKILSSIIVFVAVLIINYTSSPIIPKSEVEPGGNVLGDEAGSWVVTRVVDGDTIEVKNNSEVQKVRVIGVNTPETVDPRREVECFGKEASEKAKELLEGKSVRLSSDPTQSDSDRYGRILRYITMSEGIDYGLVMIREGFAYEYTYDNMYQKQAEYKKAQTEAANAQRGLWGDGVCK
jgi:micrococcal nuclease